MAANSSDRIMDKTAILLLKAMGADILTPKIIADERIKKLNLEKNEQYADIAIIASNLDNKEILNIIKALAITKLRVSDFTKISRYLRNLSTTVLEYVRDHPEVREEASPEELDKLMCESDTEED